MKWLAMLELGMKTVSPLTFQKNVIHLMIDINAVQDDPLIQCREQVLF
jgi:N-dimethylarginine dimethylaminohydrolase